MGSESVSSRPVTKLTCNIILIYLKLLNKCYEYKHGIFMNKLNVIQNNKTTFNEVKKMN